MRTAITDSMRTHFLAIPEEMEPEVRRATDEIFADLQYIGTDEPDLLASYLGSIEEPLHELRGLLGIQLVIVTSKGTMTVGSVLGEEKQIPWTTTDFVIAPLPCFFRADGDASALVHMLGAHCLDGHRVFSLQTDVGLHLWLSTEAVEQSFEHANVPWCSTCSMASVGHSL